MKPFSVVFVLAAFCLFLSCNLERIEELTSIMFVKTFGSGSHLDIASSVRQTTDGGYIVAGYTESAGAGSSDYYLVRTDAFGNPTWKKTFGGPNKEIGRDVQQTTDGGYIIIGDSTNDHLPLSYHYMYLIKTNSSGNQLWGKKFGNLNEASAGNAVQQTSDGGYILCGKVDRNNGDMYLVKTTANGDLVWERNFNGASINTGDLANAVQQTSDGGYIVVGQTYSSGSMGSQIFVLKTDDNGIQTNVQYHGGTGYEAGFSVQQTKDGGYIITGVSGSAGGNGGWDMYLLKLFPDLTREWEALFGGALEDIGYSIRQTADEGFIVAGTTKSTGTGEPDVYLIKTDKTGKKLLEKKFDGSSYDYGYCVRETTDEGYIIAGSTYLSFENNYDVYLIKTDKDGKAQ